ncbi:TetR/AcrR family transcriptional regulator [Mycobacterium sp. HNNTM2301]|uniref:TetR/AcrR family transcriptional regulator n=1 Tax=Mycobacterium hainanense TaxID=3289775 RepID=UPI0035A6384E
MPPNADAATPITERGRATRDRILGAAAELLLTQGSEGLRLDNVRHAASVSGSQLTHYFADKDALVRAVVQRQTEIVLDFHRQPALGDLDTFEDFERWVELTLKFSRRKARHHEMPTYGALAGQLSKYSEEVRELLAEGYDQWVALLRRGLARMKKAGVLIDSADPTALAHTMISAHEGGSILSTAYGASWPDREALDFAMSHLRRFAAHPDVRRHPRHNRVRTAIKQPARPSRSG